MPCRKRFRLNRFILPAVILFAGLLLGGCHPTPPPPKVETPMANAVAPTAEQVATFSKRTGITFPASAVLVRYHSEEDTNGAMWLQLRLPTSEFNAFLKATPIPQAAIRPSAAAAQSALNSFLAWLPTPPKKFRYLDAQIAPWRWMKCIFDFDDPRTTVIYLMWYTT